MNTRRIRTLTALVIALLFVSALPHAAAASGSELVAASTFSKYWQEFVDFWTGAIKKQNGIVMIAVGVGLVSLFIITRSKWRKG